MSEDISKHNGIISGIRRVLRIRPKDNVREVIEDILEDEDSNNIEITEHEKLLLNNVLYLRDKKCQQVMTPRANIISFQQDGSIEDLADLMISKGHSRIPIYGKDTDDIVGIIHIIDLAKSLIDGDKVSPVKSIIKNGVKFVSPSMRVPDLLSEMQKEKIHMAIVIDEYGGVDGIVTIEDLLEEIVGDIVDEYDFDEQLITIQKENNKIVADAKATLEEVQEVTDVNICDKVKCDDLEIGTIGGLVSHYAQKVPNVGEIIKGDNDVEFRILDVDSRKVKKVMIVLPADDDKAPQSTTKETK